ncbi:hypothetical protein SBADM41S_07319 [Streptomyces badius]
MKFTIGRSQVSTVDASSKRLIRSQAGPADSRVGWAPRAGFTNQGGLSGP